MVFNYIPPNRAAVGVTNFSFGSWLYGSLKKIEKGVDKGSVDLTVPWIPDSLSFNPYEGPMLSVTEISNLLSIRSSC